MPKSRKTKDLKSRKYRGILLINGLANPRSELDIAYFNSFDQAKAWIREEMNHAYKEGAGYIENGIRAELLIVTKASKKHPYFDTPDHRFVVTPQGAIVKASPL